MKITRKLVALVLALASILGCLSVLTGCGDDGPVIDNENTRLVLSTAELDGVFNPFYSSSGADNSIIGMTQIGMLSSDKEGKVAFGKDEACVVLDYKEVIIYEDDGVTPKHTVYTFILKNDLKFSNGTPLTMKDVLFNLYVYLDPQYYGSSTIYSTEIVCLEEYRTQSTDKNEQEKFNETFNALAAERVSRLVECLTTVYENNPNTSLTEAELIAQLTEEMEFLMTYDENYSTVIDDYNLAKKYFRDELKKDYSYAKGTAEDILFTDASGKEVTLKTDTEAFFYNEGFIKWNKKDKKFDYTFAESMGNLGEEEAIDLIFNYYFPKPHKVIEVVTMWNTAFELSSYFAGLEKEKYFDSLEEGKISNISGIVSLGHNTNTTTVTIGDKVYNVADEYNDNGSVKNSDEYEVLEITINKVDPKAIWNFGFTVAPMYYYSDVNVYKDFNYTDNFGVEFGSREFQDNVIKNPDKIGVPVGAGAYKATTRSGDSSAVTAGTFKAANVVYFERNEHFMFPVTIKYINFQVVSTNLMLDALYSGDVHFVEPACKQENIDSIAGRKKDGFTSTSVMTNGYGYIGINAEKVPSLQVRQAIMSAVNTQLAVDYYMGYSYSITRPMTKASWAYPTEKDALGQYYKFVGEDYDAIRELVESDGYSIGADGKTYEKNGHKLSYVFTIAGDTTDHPAYNALKRAADILNECGFDIEVKTDINALRKLSNGDLTVWAAAWGAGVDPDMYQVYHIDSTAGSTNNWGYRAIKKGTAEYEEELKLVKELSEIIDLARETLDSDRRAAYYAEALDIVMELAVELPTYQRSDLYAYNTNIIDASTLTPESELTPYNGPLSRIWEVSLKETK